MTNPDLNPIRCRTCGIFFAIDIGVVALWKETHSSFVCPNGHGLSYKPEEDSLETKVKDLKSQLLQLQEKLNSTSKELELEKAKVVELTAELEIWKPETKET